MRMWLRRGVICILLSWLFACNVYRQTDLSPLTSPISIPSTSPVVIPTQMLSMQNGPTAMWPTAQAQPTATPTSAVPKNARLCQLADLRSGPGHAMGATAMIEVSAPLTNVSTTPCVLPEFPEIQLLNSSKRPLDIDYVYPPDAVANATSDTRGTDTVVYVLPGETVAVVLTWNNWCQPPLEHGVIIQLTLPHQSGQVDIESDARAGGRCEVPKYRSGVSISAVSR